MVTERHAQLRAGLDEAASALGSVLDPEQCPVADRLAALGAALGAPPPRWPRRRRPISGVYLHGPVGRGKTWLVDELVARLPAVTVTRVHAFEAARRLHAGVARHSGTPGAIDRSVNELVGGAALLFLDELHAHDPGDAMLLARVVNSVTGSGAALVATSNYPPRGLLPDERHHHLVLPLVATLEAHCDVVALEGGPDHRRLGHGGARPGWSSGAWLRPGSAAQLAGLGLPAPEPGDRTRIPVGGRSLWVDAVGGAGVHVGYDELCGGATSVGDLAELAERYRTVVVARTPAASGTTPDERRRFANLVDVCWDRDTRLVVCSAHSLGVVLDPDDADHARTASRLSLLPKR